MHKTWTFTVTITTKDIKDEYIELLMEKDGYNILINDFKQSVQEFWPTGDIDSIVKLKSYEEVHDE